MKGYAAHEREVFEQVTEARARAIDATGGERPGAGRERRHAGLRQLIAVAESYPDLKANQNFLALQEELTGTESKIAYARQFYNDQVMRLNTLIGSFPSNVVAAPSGSRRGRSSTSRTRSAGRSQVDLARCSRRVRADRREQAQDHPAGGRGARAARRASATRSACSCGSGPVGLVIALAIALVLSFTSYRFGDRIVLASTRAKAVTAEEEPRLHNIVEGLAIAAGRAEARGVRRPRAGAERVRDRPRPRAFVGRRDPGPARDDEPRRARGRDRSRDGARRRPRHPVGTIVATAGRRRRAASEFFLRTWWWGGLGGRRGRRSQRRRPGLRSCSSSGSPC